MNTRRYIALFLLLLCFCCSFRLHAQSRDTLTKRRLKDTVMMGEVIIKAKTAIRVKGDTISYEVDSFYRNPLANTEDVLKRLPGVEVSSTGKITIQGKDVTKIFINGKEYQADDIRTITQNLPAEVLEKIEVADYYSDEAQFTGLKNGTNQKSINLKFKKQYEDGIYGRAVLGYGNKDRYQEGVFANYMNEKFRLTSIGNFNNTGVSDVTTNADNNTSGTSLPGVNTKRNGNFNFSYDPSKNWKINGSYELGTNDVKSTQSILRTTYLPGDSILLRKQNTDRYNTAFGQRLNLRSQYRFNDDLNMITDVNLNYRNAYVKGYNTDLTAYGTLDQPAFMRITNADQSAITPSVHFSNQLQKRFKKKGRTLLFTIQAGYDNSLTDGNTNNDNTYYNPPSENVNSYISNYQKNNLNTRLLLQYTEPLSEHSTLSFKYTNLYTYGQDDRKVWSNASGYQVLDTVQSRNYTNRNKENPIGLLYQYQLDKLTAGAGVDIQPYQRSTETVKESGITIAQKGINYFPNLFLRYLFSSQSTLSVNYSGSLVAPDIKQLQPVPDYTDSMNIFIGNPSLKPELSNTVSMSYNFFNPKNQKMFWVSLRGNWVNDKIINDVTVDLSKRISTPVNTNGVYNFNGSASYTQPIFTRKIKAAIGFTSGTSKNITITNGVLQSVNNFTYQPTVKLVFLLDWYEGDLSYTYSGSVIKNSSGIGNNTLDIHTIANNGTFILPWNIKLGYFLNYVVNNGLSAGFNKDFLLVNAMIDKTFTKVKGLSLRAQAYDIFNKYPNVQRTIGDNYFEDRSVNRVGSYFMFSAIYRFSYFPKHTVTVP